MGSGGAFTILMVIWWPRVCNVPPEGPKSPTNSRLFSFSLFPKPPSWQNIGTSQLWRSTKRYHYENLVTGETQEEKPADPSEEKTQGEGRHNSIDDPNEGKEYGVTFIISPVPPTPANYPWRTSLKIYSLLRAFGSSALAPAPRGSITPFIIRFWQ